MTDEKQGIGPTAKALWVTAGVFGVLFFALIAALELVDVQAIGPQGSFVGLATINGAVHDATGFDPLLYKLSGVAGYLPVGLMALALLASVVQAIMRRSVNGVDAALLSASVVCAMTFALYILFDHVVVNCRPVLIDGELAASYPSSHTLFSIVGMGGLALWLGSTRDKSALRITLQVLCVVIAVAIIIARLLCGCHWLTDIVGGCFLGLCLLFILWGALADERTDDGAAYDPYRGKHAAR